MLGYQCIHQVFLPHKKQDCIPVWCIQPTRWPYLQACTAQGGCLVWGVCSGEVHGPGGVCSGVPCLWGGVLVPGEWCLVPGGVCSGGVPGPRGGVVSKHALRQTPPPWTEFLAHATENITLPQTSFAGGKNKKPDNLTFITIFEKNAIQTLTTVPAKLDVDCTKCHRYQKQLHSYLVLGTKVIINSFKRQKQICATAAHYDTGLM